ncbi:MAG: hypothetical protein RLZZ436_2951 [Planctomycetota bacterium]
MTARACALQGTYRGLPNNGLEVLSITAKSVKGVQWMSIPRERCVPARRASHQERTGAQPAD